MSLSECVTVTIVLMLFSLLQKKQLNVSSRRHISRSEDSRSGEAYDVPPDPLVGWGGDTPPHISFRNDSPIFEKSLNVSK